MAKSFYSLSLDKASILQRIKEAYLIWLGITTYIPKGARYTIGNRIENDLLDLLELAYIAYFSKKANKLEKVSDCVVISDKLKFLISVAWEGRLISNKQYEEVALKLNEISKMFNGWKNNLLNFQNKNRTL